MLAQLYLVIVNWNLEKDTLDCIDSLQAAGACPSQIIVIDNASTDGSVAAIRRRYSSELIIIESAENLGYAGGLNLGIKSAMERGAQWIFLLNNDTIVAPDVINQFENTIKTDITTTIIAPLIYYHADSRRIWSVGDRLIPGSLLTQSLYRNQIDRGQLSPLIQVDFVTGCAMMVKREVFERVGLFPTSYFMYAEEVDFLWRARKAGYKPLVVTRARIWHKVARSTAGEPAQRRYWRIVNQILFYRRYAPIWQQPGLFLFTFIRSIGLAFSYLIKHEGKQASSSLRGWMDGWLKPLQAGTRNQ